MGVAGGIRPQCPRTAGRDRYGRSAADVRRDRVEARAARAGPGRYGADHRCRQRRGPSDALRRDPGSGRGRRGAREPADRDHDIGGQRRSARRRRIEYRAVRRPSDPAHRQPRDPRRRRCRRDGRDPDEGSALHCRRRRSAADSSGARLPQLLQQRSHRAEPTRRGAGEGADGPRRAGRGRRGVASERRRRRDVRCGVLRAVDGRSHLRRRRYPGPHRVRGSRRERIVGCLPVLRRPHVRAARSVGRGRRRPVRRSASQISRRVSAHCSRRSPISPSRSTAR